MGSQNIEKKLATLQKTVKSQVQKLHSASNIKPIFVDLCIIWLGFYEITLSEAPDVKKNRLMLTSCQMHLNDFELTASEYS